jgi:hypothetical protein
MSHNKIKVGGQSPNTSGEISVAINNLSDVNITSVSNNDFLKYNSTSGDWENNATASSSSVSIVFLGEGANQNYPETLASGSDVYFYAASPINTIGATLGSSDSYSNWYDQFTLPAGDYILQASLHGDYTGATGEAKYQFREGSNNRGASGVNLDPSNTTGTEYPGEAVSYVTLASSTTITVRLTSVTAANSTTTGLQGQRGYILIMKVN